MEQPLTISQALDEGLAELNKEPEAGNGSPTNQPDGSAPSGEVNKKPQGQPQPTDGKPGEGKPNEHGQSQPAGGTPPNGQPDPAKPTQPGIDPDKGAYSGEYTKERFDGLMSAWQKDRAAAQEIPVLKQKIQEMESALKNPPKSATPDDELPPELRNADPETQAGWRLLAKAHEGQLSKIQEKIVSNLLETLNRPVREQNETVTKINAEVEELSVELGKKFSDNVKVITKYAADNNYPLGTLRQAFHAWEKDQRIAEYEQRAKGGQKTLEEIEAEKARQAEIPHGNANRSGETPRWDEKRDGNKSLSEIFDEIKPFLTQ